jgi:hypothetical protein
MPSLLVRYAPESTDAGLTARDQLIALSRVEGLALAMEPLRTTKNRNRAPEPTDPTERLLSSLEIDPGASELVVWDRCSEWDQAGRRRTLLIPDATDGPWGDLVPLCDDSLTVPGQHITGVSHMVVPSVVLEPMSSIGGWPPDRRMAYLHIQHGRDTVGFLAFIKAWFQIPRMSEWSLVISTDGDSDSIKSHIKIARGNARDHIVAVSNDNRPELLDALVLASDMVICCHTMSTVGWRPIAMKAALAGKPLTSTACGTITHHVRGCRWVDVPPVNLDGVTDRTLVGDSTTPPIMPMDDFLAAMGMLETSFRQTISAWGDGHLAPVEMVPWTDPNLITHITGGE